MRRAWAKPSTGASAGARRAVEFRGGADREAAAVAAWRAAPAAERRAAAAAALEADAEVPQHAPETLHFTWLYSVVCERLVMNTGAALNDPPYRPSRSIGRLNLTLMVSG